MSDEHQPLWTVEDDTEATIKPCPKCGGKAILEGTYNEEIICNECGLWSGEDADSLEEAIEWWNKQPLVERLTAELTTLQQENARLAAELTNQYTRIDGFVAYIDQLERRELAALRAERWEPVEDGWYDLGWKPTSEPHQPTQSKWSGYHIHTQPDSPNQYCDMWWHGRMTSGLFHTDNVAICRLVPGQDGQQGEG